MTNELLGTVIAGKYRLLDKLGEGAMGIVYRAEQLGADGEALRQVALKMVQPAASVDSGFVKRFLREIRVATRLKSPHAVTVHDAGATEDGKLFFCMELVEGPTLREILDREDRLSPERVRRIAIQVCDVLSEAHTAAEPIVHRDLKPANLFVERRSGQDFAKVADFGIAKVIGEDATALTQAGGSMGTPRYMAPEQWTGNALDARADLYSLGIILFEMLSGAPPFTGNLQALMYKHLHEGIPPLPAGTPARLADLVQRLLAKSPDDRPASAAMVLQALAAIEPAESDPPSIPSEAASESKTASTIAAATDVNEQGRAHAWPYAVLLAAALSLGAAFVFFGLGRKPSGPLAALPKPPREPVVVEPTAALEPVRASATAPARVESTPPSAGEAKPPSHSQAEDWRKRGEAYEHGDGVAQSDEEAVKWFRKAADQGDASAELSLSVAYAQGRGVPHDHDEALKWLRKAAAQRLPEAQFNLGLRYATGSGVVRNDGEAARWYREAADQGFPQAAFHLGVFYAQGRGVPQDPAEAAKWYRRAADQGFAPAEVNLGLLYASGRGVPMSEAEAVDWFRKAARQGNERAQENLSRRHETW